MKLKKKKSKEAFYGWYKYGEAKVIKELPVESLIIRKKCGCVIQYCGEHTKKFLK